MPSARAPAICQCLAGHTAVRLSETKRALRARQRTTRASAIDLGALKYRGEPRQLTRAHLASGVSKHFHDCRIATVAVAAAAPDAIKCARVRVPLFAFCTLAGMSCNRVGK